MAIYIIQNQILAWIQEDLINLKRGCSWGGSLQTLFQKWVWNTTQPHSFFHFPNKDPTIDPLPLPMAKDLETWNTKKSRLYNLTPFVVVIVWTLLVSYTKWFFINLYTNTYMSFRVCRELCTFLWCCVVESKVQLPRPMSK